MEVRAVRAQIGKGSNHFKAGEDGEIIRLVAVKPSEESKERLCIHVRFADGKEDYYPIGNISTPGIKLDCSTL